MAGLFAYYIIILRQPYQCPVRADVVVSVCSCYKLRLPNSLTESEYCTSAALFSDETSVSDNQTELSFCFNFIFFFLFERLVLL